MARSPPWAASETVTMHEAVSHRRSSTYRWRDESEATDCRRSSNRSLQRSSGLSSAVAKLEPLPPKAAEDLDTSSGIQGFELLSHRAQRVWVGDSLESSSSGTSSVSSPTRLHMRSSESQRPKVLPSLEVCTDSSGAVCRRAVASSHNGEHPESGDSCFSARHVPSGGSDETPERAHRGSAPDTLDVEVSSSTTEPHTALKSSPPAIKAELLPYGSSDDIGSIEVAENRQPSGTLVQACRAPGSCHCGKCRLCQAVAKTHRRDSILSIDYTEAERRVSASTCCTSVGNGGESRRRSYESACTSSPCRSSNGTPNSGVTTIRPPCGSEDTGHTPGCSSVGEVDTTLTPVTASDGEGESKTAKVSFEDFSYSSQCSRSSSVAPDSPRTQPRSRTNSFLRVPERRNTLSRLEVPTSPLKRRLRRFSTECWSRSKDIETPTLDGASQETDTAEAQSVVPKRSRTRHPSAPCVPSFPHQGQQAPRRMSLLLPKQAVATRTCGPSPIQEHHWDACVDSAIETDINEEISRQRIEEEISRQRRKKPSLDLDLVFNKHSDASENMSECPLKTMLAKAQLPHDQSPKESPKGANDDFVTRLQAKLEKEALFRQRADEMHEQHEHSDDEESARHERPQHSDGEESGYQSVRSQAPDCDSVPMPSPLFMSRDNSRNITPCRSPRDSQTLGGTTPKSPWLSPRASIHSARGDVSPWALVSRNPSPRGVSPFHIPEESDCEQEERVVNSKPGLSLERDFQPGDTIGAGSFGRVFSARHRASGQIIAVKEMLLDDMGETNGQQKRLDRELRLCEHLRHERVVRYFGHEYSSRGAIASSQSLFIFLEYCSGGSVASHLRTFGSLEEPLLSKYAQQLLQGLEYLHSLAPPVVHRDLKCANLLLTHDANVKIADFGCSKWLWDPDGLRDEEAKHSMVGSVFWAAPEALRGGVELTIAVDYWSFGCCILEMATARHPWSEHQFDNIWQACRHIVFSESLPEVSKDLAPCIQEVIYACLRRDSSERVRLEVLKALPLLAAVPTW